MPNWMHKVLYVVAAVGGGAAALGTFGMLPAGFAVVATIGGIVGTGAGVLARSPLSPTTAPEDIAAAIAAGKAAADAAKAAGK